MKVKRMNPTPTFDDGSHSVELSISLTELFGVDSIDEGVAYAIGSELVDRIVSITESGRSPKGNSLKSYDKDYIDSEEFKAAGKSANDVNMTLYGDMLAQLEPIRFVNGSIVLGWQDSLQQKKAYAHMTGFKGHPTIKNGPKREFLAVSQKMLDEVKDQFIDQVGSPNEQRSSSVLSAIEIFNTVRASENTQRERSLFGLFFGDS